MKFLNTSMHICIAEEGQKLYVLEDDKAREYLILGIDEPEKAMILQHPETNQPTAHLWGDLSIGIPFKFLEDAFDRRKPRLTLLF